VDQSPATILWGGGTFSLPSFASQFGCPGCREGDPLFVNPTAGDFRPGAGSPAIGAATPSSVYASFQGLYGVSITSDAAGAARPGSDGKWDMGALESDGGIGPPAAPTNLRIVR
jgi:hypothetical protein